MHRTFPSCNGTSFGTFIVHRRRRTVVSLYCCIVAVIVPLYRRRTVVLSLYRCVVPSLYRRIVVSLSSPTNIVSYKMKTLTHYSVLCTNLPLYTTIVLSVLPEAVRVNAAVQRFESSLDVRMLMVRAPRALIVAVGSFAK